MQTTSDGDPLWAERKVESELFAVKYYDHQYDRISKLEDQRLTVSNIITGISAAIMTFGFSGGQPVTIFAHYLLPAVVVIVNVFAILYIRQSIGYIRGHRARAKLVLQRYGTEFHEIDRAVVLPEGGIWSRWKIQLYLHLILLLIAIAYTVQV